MAVVDLDNAPSWWRRSPSDNLSAAEARALAGTTGALRLGGSQRLWGVWGCQGSPQLPPACLGCTPLDPPPPATGPVRLLTHPPAAGYSQNPISVYYCYSPGGQDLERCIAEVTNTPWGERVTFLFRWGHLRGGGVGQPGRVRVHVPSRVRHALLRPPPAHPPTCTALHAAPARPHPHSTPCSPVARRCCRPEGETVPKALHVSPLMDMRSTWYVPLPAWRRVLARVLSPAPAC